MDVTPIIPSDRQVIDTYAPGRFRISNIVHDGAVLVLPERTEPWAVIGAEAITVESLAGLRAADPGVEILLIGTGDRMQLLPSRLRRALKEELGVVADAMDTRAACRTYTILLAEGRRVAAALIPVSG